MDFLFHTVVYYSEKPVYYNVYKTSRGFFAEVLDNPLNVEEARDFELESLDEDEMGEVEFANQVDTLREEISSWLSNNR